MSDNWITLIPQDPRLVPASEVREAARKCLAAFAPSADSVEVVLHDNVEFFDCGANFETVRCPHCSGVIPLEWWQDRMREDYGSGFKLAAYPTPCCGSTATLNELVYDWPQGFARFGLSAMNPNIGRLGDDQVERIAELAGCPLTVVYQHI